MADSRRRALDRPKIAWMFDKMIEVRLDQRISDLEVAGRVQIKQLGALKVIAHKTHLKVEKTQPNLVESDLKFFSKLCKNRQGRPATEWFTPTKRQQAQKTKKMFMGDLVSKFDNMYTRYWREGVDIPLDYEEDIVETHRTRGRDTSRDSKEQDFIQTFRSDHLPTAVLTPVEIKNKQTVESLELMKSVGEEAIKKGAPKSDQPAVRRLLQDLEFKLSIINKEISAIKSKNLVSSKKTSFNPHKAHQDCWRSNRHEEYMTDIARGYQTDQKSSPEDIDRIVQRLYYSSLKKTEDQKAKTVKPAPEEQLIDNLNLPPKLVKKIAKSKIEKRPSRVDLAVNALNLPVATTLAKPGGEDTSPMTSFDFQTVMDRILDYTKTIEQSKKEIEEKLRDTNAKELMDHIDKVKAGFNEVKEINKVNQEKSDRIRKLIVD